MSESNSTVFPERGVLPVIHYKSKLQAVEMAGVAQYCGASGVFLIDHNRSSWDSPDFLLEAAEAVTKTYTDLWVGVNCLTRGPEFTMEAFSQRAGVHGVWADNATRWSTHDQVSMHALNGVRDYCEAVLDTARQFDVVYFGGLAMKGAGYIEDPFAAAAFVEQTQQYVDVVTTSGPGTGIASPLERLRQIRLALEEGGRLAVASGVTVANVQAQAEYADYFLVASSIETEPMSGKIVGRKLRQMVEIVQDAELAKLTSEAA